MLTRTDFVLESRQAEVSFFAYLQYGKL